MKTYSLEESLRAQQALRKAAGLEPERFPIEAVIGMASDEIEVLRGQGRSDAEIALLIRDSSGIKVSSEDVAANYAAARHPPR